MRLGLGLGLTARRDGFDPWTLFASGAQGVWFDRQDLSSMYQDAAGTTACAVGSPVGLALDKSKGLVRGPELVADVLSGWTPVSGGTQAVVGSELEITANGTAFAGLTRAVPCVVGQTYEILATSRRPGAGTWQMAISGIASSVLNVQPTATGQRITFVATAVSHNFGPYLPAGTAGEKMYLSALSIKALPGNHATQGTAASRPILRQDASGRYYLEYDGVDDGMATAAIDFTGTNKISVVAGVYKASDASIGMFLELSATAEANAGAFRLTAPNSTLNGFMFNSGGSPSTSDGESTNTTSPAPFSAVVTGQADIAAPLASLRVNGIASASSAVTQGTGNYGNYPLYIGRRNGSTLPFNGRDYGLIVVGRTLNATEIARTERFLASRMGVAL